MAIQWNLSKDLLQQSIQIMAPRGAMGNEGLALWLGARVDDTVLVTHVVELTGPGFRSSPLQLSISMRGMSTLTELAAREDAYLVGQIHSHPGTFVDLSEVDIIHGIRIPDYLSVVCPHYAQDPSTRLSQCGIHVFESGNYRRLGPVEAGRRVLQSAAPIKRLLLEVPA